MYKRNWIAIADLLDYHLRLAVSLASDPEILDGFVRGFPHLFLEGEDEGPLRIPLSALRDAAFEYSRGEYPDPTPENLWDMDSHFWLSAGENLYPHLSVPTAFDWDDQNPIPVEILSQFVGQKAEAGIRIIYRGRQYVVLDLIFKDDQEPKIGSTFEAPPKLDSMSLVDTSLVALDK